MKNKNISNSEWKIMKVLWETPYITLRQIYEKAGVSEGWSYTTVRTLVTRLVDKEAAA
ncbi:MAG: BlaI/MecI/CopY family transcriptional regulator, partial [Clostridia bacterium]|nr:BlaI/MecI/CopY family transcriptional regulator [Clostridia bacterium]